MEIGKMLRLLIVSGSFLTVIKAQFGGGPGIFNVAPGMNIDYNQFNSLEAICNSAVMMTGVNDQLSDVMGAAVQHKMQQNPMAMSNPAALLNLGGTSPKWQCLMGAVSAGGRNPAGVAGGIADYFDTAPTLKHTIPFFNPCDMVFCGEPGMTPMAMLLQVSQRMRLGQSLGNLASYLGPQGSQLAGNSLQPRPVGGPPMGGPPMGGAGVPSPNGMANMFKMAQQMMNTMNNQQTKPISPNSTSGVPAVPANGSATNTVTGQQPTPSVSANSPANGSPPGGINDILQRLTQMGGHAPSFGMPAVGGSGGIPGMGGMGNLMNAMMIGDAMLDPPDMPGMGRGMGMPGIGMPGMNVPGMGTPGLNIPGMGTPGLNIPGMGMPGLSLPGAGGMMPGMNNLLAQMASAFGIGGSSPSAQAATTGLAGGQAGMGGFPNLFNSMG